MTGPAWTQGATTVVCAGCGARAAPDDPYPFRCPRADGDDVDHVMTVCSTPRSGGSPEEGIHAIAARRAEADGHVVIDYGLHLIVTDVSGRQLDELPEVVASGVQSAKVYTTYKASGFYLDDWSWYRLLQRAADVGMLVTVHAENDDLLAHQRQRPVAGTRGASVTLR